MEENKISKIAKKKLTVKAPEIPEVEIKQVITPIIEPEVIEAPKKKRGGKPENLALGRAKLAETWAEKRRLKEELTQQAIDKKLKLVMKQKETIYKDFGVKSDSEEEEEIMEPIKKVVRKVISKPVKKPKTIKYIEESESEEEIVYVKKPKQPIQQPTKSNIIFY